MDNVKHRPDAPLPLTEEQNPSTVDLDLLDTHELLHRINDEDRRCVWAVERELDVIGTAVDAIAKRLSAGGRLHYFGAGTSGRVAVMDAAEIPPTFSMPKDLVSAHIAGGADAMAASIEAAEDDEEAGAAEAALAKIGARDVAIGLSASGGAPYVLGAMRAARSAGALTIGIANSPGTELLRDVEIPIALLTGPEVIAGSTRMKAASAQKMALTTISTAVMVKLGRVHGNLMVDVDASNEKLRARARRVVKQLTSAPDERVTAALEASGQRVKEACVMLASNCGVEEARSRLAAADGSLRKALAAPR
jgi:N-acetylmuramic acid 6-phosphate etherase